MGRGSLRTSLAWYRTPAAVAGSPCSMARITGSASPSQRSRSGAPEPNGSPNATCSVSNQAAPRPRTARPPLMWSSVVAIFATRLGSRNVFAPTIRPTVLRFVVAAQAVIVSQPSNIGPSADPTMG